MPKCFGRKQNLEKNATLPVNTVPQKRCLFLRLQRNSMTYLLAKIRNWIHCDLGFHFFKTSVDIFKRKIQEAFKAEMGLLVDISMDIFGINKRRFYCQEVLQRYGNIIEDNSKHFEVFSVYHRENTVIRPTTYIFGTR